jgi:CheY-like chemotaxis protein
MREAERPTVLVAHYDEDTRSLLRFWLEAEGYCVTEAADGQEAAGRRLAPASRCRPERS